MTDSPQDPAQTLWQSQSRGVPAMSLEQVREKARRLERRVSRRNLREYIAAVVVVFAMGWTLWRGPSGVARIGAGLIIAATLFICYRLHVHGAAESLRTDLGMKCSLDFYRAQLERQRDLLRSVWLWYLLPFVPGMLTMQIGQALAQPARVWRVVAWGVVMSILMLGGHLVNRRAAARIQRRLDSLEDNS